MSEASCGHGALDKPPGKDGTAIQACPACGAVLCGYDNTWHPSGERIELPASTEKVMEAAMRKMLRWKPPR